MKYIIGVFLVLDCCYQLFFDYSSVNGMIFYDITHYGTFLAICTYYFIVNNDSYYAFLAVYFFTILIMVVKNIGLTKAEFLEVVGMANPVYTLSFVALFLIGSYILWKTSKTTGR